MLLEEFVRPAGLSQRRFAADPGWAAAKLDELVKRRRGVTAESALDLAKALGTSAERWMILQMTRDLRRAEISRRASWAWAPPGAPRRGLDASVTARDVANPRH